jgi:uncharacterized membrane protein HdeD (DUF308 family)
MLSDQCSRSMTDQGSPTSRPSSTKEVDVPESPSAAEDLPAATGLWWIPALAGVISIVVGIIVLAKPSNSLETLAVVSGIFVLLDGIVALVEALFGGTESRGLVAILGVVSVVVGILLIRHPVKGVNAVALLLGIWLIAAAVVRLVVAFTLGVHLLRRVLIAVILGIAGIAIISSPHIRYGTLALIAGIGFIGYGAAMVVLGLAMRTVGHDASPATPSQAATT